MAVTGPALVIIMGLGFGFGNPPAAYSDGPDIRLLVFGDSLTAGYGLAPEQSFPARLQARLEKNGHQAVRVINAGVSGDTTSGGLTRLEWTLDGEKPDAVILELGANDMLRAVDPQVTRQNLVKMLEILKTRDIPVLLSGMKSFRNLGALFGDSYQKMFKNLAKEYDTGYYPFFLEGVALEPGMVQEDGLHPTARSVEVIVDGIFSEVEDLLERIEK